MSPSIRFYCVNQRPQVTEKMLEAQLCSISLCSCYQLEHAKSESNKKGVSVLVVA
ncbi:hypothetical protein HYPSUDRAFT_47030 [Hypholoma sublateritium FD-334 SS-4]|uniref:Uncharacterized protein n=1 Tax=Hypholoma sublateritium (strain FD-334 SS-4) TaxID=945553 RepID=A0A0D2KQ77_HYPSF|nr:hypothetical protein HYPSUDRAFT_47030 [Hypholoma sublateritium FD-334 SS-4]